MSKRLVVILNIHVLQRINGDVKIFMTNTNRISSQFISKEF